MVALTLASGAAAALRQQAQARGGAQPAPRLAAAQAVAVQQLSAVSGQRLALARTRAGGRVAATGHSAGLVVRAGSDSESDDEHPKATAGWWKEHAELFADVRSSAAWDSMVGGAKPSETVVVEWVSPSCKHCYAAQGTMLLACEAINKKDLPVTFMRVACDDPDTKALARAKEIRAFPTIGMYRGGAKLVEFNPSQRGDPVGRLKTNIELVATTTDEDKAFQMLSGEVRVIDAPPKAKVAAAPVAVAAAAAVVAVAAGGDDDEDGDCDEKEECAPTWD